MILWKFFFKIDIDTYTPQTKLFGLQNLTLSDVESTSEHYLPIHASSGGFYLALDCNFRRLFVLFSDPYSLLYGPEVGKRVQNQVRENVTHYASVQPPGVPNSKRHSKYEQWLLENPELCVRPESRCGVFNWGLWMERGHESRGPVITPDTNAVPARLEQFLLGAIEKDQRDKMREAIQSLPASCKELWCKSDKECFALRACLVNVLTEPHVDCGDMGWAMISPFGNFDGGEFCIADLGRRFAFHEGHIAAIRSRRLVHFTRKWVGSRISLVSTMHRALIPHCTKRCDSGERVSAERSDGRGEGEPAQKGPSGGLRARGNGYLV